MKKVLAEIELALKTTDPATFQQIVTHVLGEKGYEFLTAPGSAIGKSKTTKGSPDALFQKDGKYVLVECTTTTKEDNVKHFLDKLKKDIGHALEVEKQGIKAEELSEVILACNSKVTFREVAELKKYLKLNRKSQATLTVLSLQTLANDLSRFPYLCSLHLGFHPMIGSVYSLPSFLLKTKKLLQPDLTNSFYGLETDLTDCIRDLKTTDILLITGPGGSGKTRFAVELLKRMEREGFTPIVVEHSLKPLYEDFSFFNLEKKYMILLDDANKNIQNAKFLLSKITEPDGVSAKVIITSRNKEREGLLTELKSYPHTNLVIPRLNATHMSEILCSTYPELANNSTLVDQLLSVSKGNPRLLRMGCEACIRNGCKELQINEIYESYLANALENSALDKQGYQLRALGILAFFSLFSIEESETKFQLEEILGLKLSLIEEALLILVDLELVDSYHDKLFKLADQELATCLFYKCFIDEKTAIISFHKWTASYIEKYSKRLEIIMEEVVKAFTAEKVASHIYPDVKRLLAGSKDKSSKFTIYIIFWKVVPNDCLEFLNMCILSQIETSAIPSYPNQLFNLLENFFESAHPSIFIALDITIEALCAWPEYIYQVTTFLKYMFNSDIPDNRSVDVKNRIFDVLIKNACEKKEIVIISLLENLIEIILQRHVTKTEITVTGVRRIEIITDEVETTVLELRNRALRYFESVFDPFSRRHYEILSFIAQPLGGGCDNIYRAEHHVYERIVSNNLDVRQFTHYRFVWQLEAIYDNVRLNIPKEWRAFKNFIQQYEDVINPACDEKFRGWISCLEVHFELFLKNIEFKDVILFFKNLNNVYCLQIIPEEWNLTLSIRIFIKQIVQKFGLLSEELYDLYCLKRFVLPGIETLVSSMVYEYPTLAPKLLNRTLNSARPDRLELIGFILKIPQTAILQNIFFYRLIWLIQFTKWRVNLSDLPEFLKYEENYRKLKLIDKQYQDDNLIVHIVRSLFAKNRIVFDDLNALFETCTTLFVKDAQLLFLLYCCTLKEKRYLDADGLHLSTLLDLDSQLIQTSISLGTISIEKHSANSVELLPLNVLWREKHNSILFEVLEFILNWTASPALLIDSVEYIFLVGLTDGKRYQTGWQVLNTLLARQFDNNHVVSLLAEVASCVFNDQFPEFYCNVINLRNDVTLTKSFSYGRTHSTIGSWIPVINNRITLFKRVREAVMALDAPSKYLSHINLMDDLITRDKLWFAREERNDWMERQGY